MSFSVRRIEDPTIHVRRNIKPDILGISSAWDNIVDIKQSLSRLEGDVVAANKKPKLAKNTRSSDGKVLKEISRETQQLGKVTRFQLLDEKPRQNVYTLPKAEARKIKDDWSTVSDISTIEEASYSGLNKEKDGYSPTRYTSGTKTTTRNERPTYFETTTVHPAILNDLPSIRNDPPTFLKDTPPSKDTSFANTSVTSSSSQQFSVTSSPSFHGKTVLARNEGALQKIKEKVRKQKEMLSRTEESRKDDLGDRKLHESTDHVNMSGEARDKSDVKPAAPLKRKVGTISAAGPTYKGFNAVSEPKVKKFEKQKVQTRISKEAKEKLTSKLRQEKHKEKKNTKGKMTRIVGSKRPQEVITTTSWKDGQANVKRILNAKQVKLSGKQPGKIEKARAKSDKTTGRMEKGPLKNEKPKADATYDVESEDELSEGRLSSDEDVIERFNARIERSEAEKDVLEDKDKTTKPSVDVSLDSDDQSESKIKHVLPKEAKSMLDELAKDSSESETEPSRDMQEEKPKTSPPKKKMAKTKKPATSQKPAEDFFPKGKTRHYDQAEVQKYMAHQLAERKRKQKQERMQKRKQEEEKQQRLKDLYERQKKSFALPKRDKRLGKTFSFGNFDVRIPSEEEFHPGNNQEFVKKDQVVHGTDQNESDKENTDINETLEGSRRDMSTDTEDADVTLTEDMLTNRSSHESPPRRVPAAPVVVPAPNTSPLDQRAQRLTALQATALALQSRLQSHALRLSGAKEGAVPQAKVMPQQTEVESGFQGVLPGVVNIRKQADENEKQSTRAAAATKIQAAYRGHTVRKRQHWTEEKSSSKRSGNTAPALATHYNTRDTLRGHELEPNLFPSSSHAAQLEHDDIRSEGSSDDVHFRDLLPFYETERLNNNSQRAAPKVERKFQYDELRTRSNFHRNDFSAPSVPHFTVPPRAHFEPKGDRFSVMNIFSRRHPTLPVEDILNEEPGSETASLLEVNRGKDSDQNMDYEEDFTDASSVVSEDDLKKDASKAETYSECFETDEDTDTKHSRRPKDKTTRSSSQGLRDEQRNSHDESEERQLSKQEERRKPSPLSEDDNVLNRREDDFVLPVMASTLQPDTRSSPSLSPSEENEPIRRRYFMPRPVDRSGGDRLSPDSLQRKFTAEINLLENVEDAVRQVSDIERSRGISLAQQETVSLAQILKAQQHSHEQELRQLRLKAKEEASQAAMDLEKTRQASAVAAASAAERLAEVQTEAIKTNAQHSRKYMEQATRMTSDLLSDTSNQLAQFCKNLTTTTSAAVEDLHKTRRPTTTLVERGTSISERHATNSEHSSISDERTRTSDVISNQSKSLESSPSVTSPRRQAGYSSDEFESYKSQSARQDGSDVKTTNTVHPSLSAESIVEDLPEKSVSEDTTIQEDELTAHDESANDARESLPWERSSKAHDSVSSVLDYSSQFDDSSHALTDEDIDFNFLLPSREHRRKSIRRIKDISFDEDKRKEKSVRTLFESDDSFGKFTADMIQQYVRKEEVRMKHQAAILRLREKSLKDKTKADLHWLEKMKKQSRDKGSDDVMPSIKKRERGIKMKLKAEKEEIKCLRAANRAASFQRRFMIYQQQEIQRLHQATLSIRERIQKDTSRKGSDHSSNEPSQSLPRTSSPVSKPKSNSQSTPGTSASKSETNLSPSAKSVSEDISGEQGSMQASPNTTGSSFPSYSTPKSEKQEQPSTSARGQQEPETSTILNMLSTVGAGAQGAATCNGELVKIHKMLLERQKKLVKDESEVNSMLQKVTEMLKNQKNLSNQSENAISEASQSKSSIPEANQSGARIADGSQSRHSKASGKSPSEQSIPEEISSIAKSVSEEIKPDESAADKTGNDYDNATFESDDSTTRSRRSAMSQRVTPQNGEVNIEDETFSLTETSDHSDMEERVRRLNEELERQKKKAEALERKKRKLKRSAMRKEAIKLEIEIQNTKDDNYRKLAEIKIASEAAQSTTPIIATSPVKPHKPSPLEDTSPRGNRVKSGDYTTPVSENTSLVSDRGIRSTTHEVEESLIEVLDDSPKSDDGRKRPSFLEMSSVRTESQASARKLHSDEIEESVVEIIDEVDMGGARERADQQAMTPPNEVLKKSSESRSPPVLTEDDVSEHISEHSRSSASIPEQVPSVGEEKASKSLEIPEELSERSYTPIPSDASGSEDDSKVRKFTHLQDASVPEQSLKSAEDSTSKVASYSYGDDTFENSYTEPKSGIHKQSASVGDLADKATEDVKISPEKTPSISEHLTGSAEQRPSVSEHLTKPSKRSASVSDEPSYTEPESDTSVSDESLTSHRRKSESEDKSLRTDKRKRSDASDISKSLFSDKISQKSRTSTRRSTTEDERSKSDRQTTKRSPRDHQSASKSSISEKQRSTGQHEAELSPKQSTRGSVVDDIGSHSEISSIAEDIPSGYEDVSEGEGVLKDEEVPIFGDFKKDNNIDTHGSDSDRSGGTKSDLIGLGVNGLQDHEAKYAINKIEIEPETDMVKPELDNSDFKESHVDQGETVGECAADIVPVKQISEGSKSLTSRSSDEHSKGFEKEQQYSDDFDDVSIPEEISEIGEDFSEIGEDIDKGEDFAVFVATGTGSKSREDKDESREDNDESRSVKDDESQAVKDDGSRERESEARVKHVVDNITDVIFRDIVSDSVTTVKNLTKTKTEKTTFKNSLTKAFSTVTRTLVDKERPLDTRGNIIEHEDRSIENSDKAVEDRRTRGHIDSTVDITATDRFTGGYIGTELDGKGETTDRQSGRQATVDVTQEHIDTKRGTDGQKATDKNKEAHLATDRITKDLLADAIMQMIEIKRRKKEKNIAVKSKPSEIKSPRTASAPELSTSTGETFPEKIHILTGKTSRVQTSEIETPVDDETAINNALLIAKSNQVLDDDALRSIDDDIAGLLGTSVDDEDEFPVNVTNFTTDTPSDNEASLPEYAPLFAVPHSAQELTPMVNSAVDILLEQRKVGRPLQDCVPQAQFLAGETESELGSVSIQSYRHLVFDLTKEVFIDTVSQNEPAIRPPWAKAKWKGGQKLSRHFKRWKSDKEIRAAVLERVTNVIGLGAPRATMATIPRKTPVRGNKKDNVDAILIEELRQEEPLWTDYEEDETTVKFQVADAILNMLLEDTARVFNAIQAKKNVPDNVLVV